MRMFGVLVAIAAVIPPLFGQSVDKTVVAREVGQDVVDAVVDRINLACIFDNDKLMLRRMAKAESRDGEELKEANDYSGGIWRIGQNDYDYVKDQGGTYMASISQTMGIDFASSEYNDLEKPLYSGLAASIKLALKTSVSGVPWNCTSQAKTWISVYAPELGSPIEQEYLDVCSETATCDTPKADIVIVIDESSSIGASNFDLVKKFVEDLVGAFHVSSSGIRIGILKYSASVKTVTELGKLTSTAAVQEAVRDIVYEGQGTRTDLALLAMKDMLLGGRGSEGIPQIGIILTDGQSSDPDALKEAVNEISQESFTIFSIGVTSGAVLAELQQYGSDPDCLHVYLLDSFDDMSDFVGQIQGITCKAPAELAPAQPVVGELAEMEYLFFRLKVKRTRKGITIKLRMETGSCKMFLSWKVRNPGPAIYDYTQDVSYNDPLGGAMYIPYPDEYYMWDEIYLYGAIVGGPGTLDAVNHYIMDYTDGMFSDGAGTVKVNLILLGLLLCLVLIR